MSVEGVEEGKRAVYRGKGKSADSRELPSLSPALTPQPPSTPSPQRPPASRFSARPPGNPVSGRPSSSGRPSPRTRPTTPYGRAARLSSLPPRNESDDAFLPDAFDPDLDFLLLPKFLPKPPAEVLRQRSLNVCAQRFGAEERPSDTEPDAEEKSLSEDAWKLLEMGLYAAAIRKYSSAIELSPSNPHLYKNRAIAHLEIGSHDAAVDDCKTCIRLKPGILRNKMESE